MCFTCVFWCASVGHTMTALSLFLSLLLFVLSQVMRETDTQVKWPSKLKIGAKSKKGDKFLIYFSHTTSVLFVLSPSWQVFFCSHRLIYRFPWIYSNVQHFTHFKLFLSRSTCEGGGEESQCFGSQKKDTGSAGNKGEGSCTWFSQFDRTIMSTMYGWRHAFTRLSLRVIWKIILFQNLTCRKRLCSYCAHKGWIL